MEQVIKNLQEILDRLKWQQEMKVKGTNREYSRQLEKAIKILKNHTNG